MAIEREDMLSVMPRGRWFAATLVVAVAAAIGVVSLKTGNGSGDFVALITAANGLPRRPILARITAGLAYHMPEAAARRSSNAATKLRLYRAAAALEKNAGRQRGASTLYELGIAQLLIGVPGPAVRSLEEALLAETRERELIDAIHSSANPRLLTDLAAAHYELGRQTGNEDPHIAVEAAQRAWTLSKTPVTAWNRALAVENMHVSELTRAAWSDYLALDARSAWASEARTRDAAARRITLFDQWMSVRKTLLPLAQRGADGSIAAIAVKFPQYARVQVEDHILPEWGRAELRGDELRAADQLHLAAAIATALRIYSGDTTLSDAVDAIHGSVGVRRRALADGYALFGDGRRLIQAQEIAQAAASFETAEKRARVARAPLADHAAYQRGVCLFMRNDYAAAGAMAERVEKSISHSQSRLSLHARIAYFRGLVKIQMGDPDGALALYREATHDYEAAREYDSVALISGRIADALDHVGEVDEASIVRMRSLSILDGVGESARRDPILFDAADVALTRGWYETAQLLFTPIAEPAGQQPMWRCGALLARSSAYAAAEEHEAAVRDYKRARSACDAVPDADVRERVLASAPILMTESSDGRVQDISKSIEFLNRTKNRIWLPEMYRRLGKMYAAAGDRKRAESAYRAGIEVGHQIAATVTDPMQRESFQSHVEALFASLVGSLIGRGDFLEALQVAERGRGQSQRQSGTDIAAVSRSLRDDVAIVDLKWTPQALAGWVITSKGVTPFITSIDSLSFGAIVSRCRSNPGCVEADRRQLYDFVVRPWVDEVRHCCQTAVLVVDGDLDALPFGALEDRRSGRPLVQDFAVATAPSIETVLQSGSAYARRSLEPERVVLVGPPAHDALRHPNLAALDSAKDEVRWLRHQYKGAEEVAGTEATKNRFLAAAREATLLQYSGHAIAVAIPAASSALVLAPETKSQPDDLLYVRDLYAVRFPRLRLAVLAACSTAARNSRTKSGSASIARGFLASGVPIVVGTLWPVDDTVANAFTRALHRELKAGKDPVLAVRGAQLALLTSATPEFRKLSSWAAFTACGAGDVLKTKGREHA
jgi:tetratricopeptide (TPR) repeat protein